MTETATPKTIYLKDYTSPDYRIESLDLRFELDEKATTVHSRLRVVADYEGSEINRPLVLDGQDLELLSLQLDGEPLSDSDYTLDSETLTIKAPPRSFVLEVVTRINPAANTALEGLYTSGGHLCTQCEAEGFRKITYFPDRPDVMTVYTTTIIADKERYPVMLANGNLIEAGELEEGRHYASWNDPFPKPCYLFALVAGDLACVEDTFVTASGREVALKLYVQHGNEDKTGHAMASLKKAMRWDEECYGREYDLDIYMIVAVDDFNMGAMENKGLNIFNSRFVLARPETATDVDFVNIEGVIAHEYFHNWSGNRVTCRDWFQLSLKEGFTVFRDQQFTADMTSQAVKRIDDVRLLRTRQFAEDAGPMAHPIRPDSYVEINNFYTLTVYEKGAEVVRMLHTLLGGEGFRKGSDLYFARHDGQAVTTDDFVAAMEEANGIDLSRFRNWYSQAGTPVVKASGQYDEKQRRYTLTLKQQTPPTPGQQEKQPLAIPVRLALFGGDGNSLPLQLEGEQQAVGLEQVIVLGEAEQDYHFINITRQPIPSLLRGFSAPVKLEMDYSASELAFLMGHDNDPFNRWEAGQQLALRVMQGLIGDLGSGCKPELDESLSAAFGMTLKNTELDPALIAEALTLPEEEYVGEFQPVVEPQQIHKVRQTLRKQLAQTHRNELLVVYRTLNDKSGYRIDAESMGQRRLKNLCLGYLMELGDETIQELCMEQFRDADNMTDVMAALSTLVHTGSPVAEEALDSFYQQWHNDSLVLDKWFAIQAMSPQPDTLDKVKSLTEHPDFNLKNPNRARSLIGAFCMRNPVNFHQEDGEGYRFLADYVLELNGLNPQIASRMLEPLTHWRRFNKHHQQKMKLQLERILAEASLSKDVYEVASKSLSAR